MGQASPASPDKPIEIFVGIALRDNPGLRAERAKINALRQVPSQARALPDPVADVEFMNISLRNPSIKDTFSSDIALGVTQTLPFPGKRALAASKAEADIAAEEARLRTLESELRGEVTAAAYRFAEARDLLAINAATQEVLRTTAQSAAAVYASGQGSQSDVLLAQAALTKAEAERSDLEKQKGIVLAKISSLLAGPPDESGLDALALPEPGDVPDLSALLAEIPDTSPGVLAAKADAATSAVQVDVAKRDFKPDFIVGGRYRWKDTTMGGGDWLTAVAGVTLPFFHRRDRYQPALQEAMSRRESARYGVEEAVNSSRYALTEAYQRALRNARVFGLYRQGLLVQARLAFESALSAYTVGKVDFASVLLALTNLYSYEAEAVMAQADFQEAQARIEALIGHALPFPSSPSPASAINGPAPHQEH